MNGNLQTPRHILSSAPTFLSPTTPPLKSASVFTTQTVIILQGAPSTGKRAVLTSLLAWNIVLVNIINVRTSFQNVWVFPDPLKKYGFYSAFKNTSPTQLPSGNDYWPLRVRTVAKRHMRSPMFTASFILVSCVKLP